LPTVREELLNYYERELTYLRQMGGQFAQKYPKLAERLLLEPDRCEDPHVERLLEGFALLAARVHLKLNDDFSEISSALLEALYPHYIRPVPSMSVVELQLDPGQGKLSTGLKIPKGSALQSNRINGVACKFRTVYETTVWPVEVSDVSWRSSQEGVYVSSSRRPVATLKLSLRCFPDVTFKALELRSLRFYLSGESNVINTLYELLFNNCISITVRDPERKPGAAVISLSPDLLKAVGFAEDEGMLPYDRRSFMPYRLLQDYFSFPEKFFFIELCGLERLGQAGFGAQAEISFTIAEFERPERHQILELGISAKTLKLNCSPIVNLFPQAAEPIAVDHTKFEYPVVPDLRKQTTTEIFSVDRVTAQNSRTRELTHFEPFYAFRHAAAQLQHPAFWHISRRGSEISDDLPTQVFLSLVDLTGTPVDPDADAISVHSTCTNSNLPSKLPIGNENGDFQLEGFAAVQRIMALRRPTSTLRPPLGKATLWNLVSLLSLNYLSLAEEGKESLQEILRLYNFSDSPSLRNQINGIRSLKSSRQFGVINSEQGSSLARGTRVEIECNEDQFAGGGVYLFSSVLEKFLGLYVSMNSFSQLVVSTPQRKEVVREWPPRAGNSLLM
jgi:type VI secretion system protein ImpG